MNLDYKTDFNKERAGNIVSPTTPHPGKLPESTLRIMSWVGFTKDSLLLCIFPTYVDNSQEEELLLARIMIDVRS